MKFENYLDQFNAMANDYTLTNETSMLDGYLYSYIDESRAWDNDEEADNDFYQLYTIDVKDWTLFYEMGGFTHKFDEQDEVETFIYENEIDDEMAEILLEEMEINFLPVFHFGTSWTHISPVHFEN